MRPHGSTASKPPATSAAVPPRVAALLAATVALALLISGCSSESGGSNVATREPATPAAAPTTSHTPAGEILPVDTTITAMTTDPETGLLATLDDTGTTLTVLDPTAGPEPVHTLDLPTPAADLAQGRPGEALLAADRHIIRVDLAAGTTSEIAVAADLHTVELRPDDTLAAGTTDGSVYILTPDGQVQHTVDGLASADDLAITNDDVTVLDRRQTLLAETNIDDESLGLSLRAGDGATNLLADPFGRLIVADTDGGELLVFTTEPLVLRQRFPVGSSPYALAYDRRSDTVWVTCTQSNEVVGFDLSTGIPVETGRYPTVGQPNTITVDDRTGDLFVGSARDDGLQRIRADERKRGQ